MREFDLISRIRSLCRGEDERILIGPGDDMALVRTNDCGILLAVDQLVEERHFSFQTATPFEAGRKAVARSLSDIAAMAGIPLVTLATACLNRNMIEEDADSLMRGLIQTAEKFDCPLVGGDISLWDGPLMLTVTVTATPTSLGPVCRRGALPGDRVFVTGSLGGSLHTGHHLNFSPRISEALRLHKILGKYLHAMIDISDGLGRDAGHIADESDVTIKLFTDKLPLNRGITWQQAVSDGEDYELCFCADINTIDDLQSVADIPVSEIGVVTEKMNNQSVLVITPDGKETDAADFGWEHSS